MVTLLLKLACGCGFILPTETLPTVLLLTLISVLSSYAILTLSLSYHMFITTLHVFYPVLTPTGRGRPPLPEPGFV